MVFAVSYYALPPEFTGIFEDADRVVKNWHLFFCVACGLWGGLVIGIATEYFTSNRYSPVQARRRPCPKPDRTRRARTLWRFRPGADRADACWGARCQQSLCLSGGGSHAGGRPAACLSVRARARAESLRRLPQPQCRSSRSDRGMQPSPDRLLALVSGGRE